MKLVLAATAGIAIGLTGAVILIAITIRLIPKSPVGYDEQPINVKELLDA
jgi:hypothetical protein